MDLINLLKLAGLAVQSPAANAEVEEDVPGKANTKPDPQMFPDGPSNLGSVSDTSLRRYLKARGQPVSVDETTYPDYSVDDVLESYEAYTAEKAKNPYAIGMASAMKTTGDKPPLKKSTINKAHKIAKGIDESSLNEANWRLDGGKTHMVGGNLSYDDKLEYLLSDEDADVINNFLAQADDDEKSKVWRMFWDHQEMGDQAEGPELAIQYAKDAMGMNENDEAMSGTYAEVEYDYSEDFGMITLYKNGQKIEHWNGYFGADTVGNPLADKFVELAMKHNLNPEGMSITDDTGATGTFGNNTFNWDQFAKESSSDETEDNEYDDDDIMSDRPPAGIDFNTNNLPKVDWDRYSDQDVSDFFRRLDNLDFENNGSYRDDLEWLDQNVLSKRGLTGTHMRESYISELTRVLKNSGQLLNEAGGIGGGISGNKFGTMKGNYGLPNVAKALGDIMPQFRQTPSSDNLMRQPTAPAGGGIKGLERAPWSPGDSGAPGDVAIRKVKPDWDNGSIAQSIQRIKKFDPTPAASVDRDRQGPGNVGTDVRNVDRDRQGPGNVGFSKPSYGPGTVSPGSMPAAKPSYGPGTVSPGSMPADPDFGKKGRGLAPNTPRVGGKSATITPPVSRPNLIRPPRPNVGGARPEGPAAGMPRATPGGARPEGPAAAMPKAPPQPASFKDAFRAARKEAGGAGGTFMWNGKPYQTNIKGEPAMKWNSPKLKKVGNWSASESTNEAAKPDFLDMDKDGNKKEPMKKAVKDKEKVSESISYLKRLAGI